MKPRFAGPTIVPEARWAPALVGAAVALLAAVAVPSYRCLKDKEAALLADRTVGIAVDLDDVDAFVPDASRSAFVSSLRYVPVSLLTVRASLNPEEENRLRSLGFHLLWKLVDGAEAARLVPRIGSGDGVMIDGEFVLETPGLAESVAAALRRHDGFLALVEFSPDRPLFHLPFLVPDHLIRAHVIPTRETVWPKPALWRPRISRAVRDRWVRLVSVRFSSSWPPAKNVEFIRSVATRLGSEGFKPGEPSPLAPWRPPFAGAATVALILAVLAPLAAIAGLVRFSTRGAIVPFTVATAWSTLAGVVAHGLIASPAAVAGVAAPHGVKAALILPLMFGLLLLLDRREFGALFRRRVTWGDVALIGVAFGGVLVLYLMRSGNTPRLAVTDAERGFRDVLESFLRARPRFKEFAIGHPLLIAGLYLRGRARGFWKDGRALIWIGMIGQISVVNTFLHAPAPVAESLLRTINGWWIGALVSLPLCHFLHQLAAFAPDAREVRP